MLLNKALVYGITKFIKIISYGVEVNLVDDCIYKKFSGRKFIILVLYVDDIQLSSYDLLLQNIYISIYHVRLSLFFFYCPEIIFSGSPKVIYE